MCLPPPFTSQCYFPGAPSRVPYASNAYLLAGLLIRGIRWLYILIGDGCLKNPFCQLIAGPLGNAVGDQAAHTQAGDCISVLLEMAVTIGPPLVNNIGGEGA